MQDKLSFTRADGGGPVYISRSSVVSVTKGDLGTNIRLGAGHIFFEVVEALEAVMRAVWPDEETI